MLLKEISKNALSAACPGILEHRHRRRGYEPLGGGSLLIAFEGHRRVIEERRPLSGSLLEIGPGGNLAMAELFIEHGCERAVCIDIEPWAVASSKRVEYYCPCSIEWAPFPADSFDLIVSTACFEHFADPKRAITNIARMLRPGGVTSHQIDLRDHRDFERPLDFLRYSDRFWKLATSHRPGQPNRWRASDLLACFDSAGLAVYHVESVPSVAVSEAERQSFAPRFRDKTLTDLGTLGLFLAAEKPLTAAPG